MTISTCPAPTAPSRHTAVTLCTIPAPPRLGRADGFVRPAIRFDRRTTNVGFPANRRPTSSWPSSSTTSTHRHRHRRQHDRALASVGVQDGCTAWQARPASNPPPPPRPYHCRPIADQILGVEWSGVEWSGVEWSGVAGRGVEGGWPVPPVIYTRHQVRGKISIHPASCLRGAWMVAGSAGSSAHRMVCHWMASLDQR